MKKKKRKIKMEKKDQKNENNHALLTFIKKKHLKYQTRKKS